MKGTEYALTLKVSTYPEGNLAIKLYQESFGQLVFWDSLTVNLGGLCPKDCGYINILSLIHIWREGACQGLAVPKLSPGR